jgi:hypothetical protein
METQNFLMIHNGTKFESISIYDNNEQATDDFLRAVKAYKSEYEIRLLTAVNLIKAVDDFFKSNVAL